MSDTYSVSLVPSAVRELEALRGPVLERVFSAVMTLQDDPRPRGYRKLVGGESQYRLRVEDYRVVYGVDDAERSVVVYRIRHRSEVYD